MNKISAEILADSINLIGHRITTMKVTFPRIVLAEFNTHRAFSRNSASSRAIPFKKMVEMVENDPFIPIAWQKAHKGMQGADYFDETESLALVDQWLAARDRAVTVASQLADSFGVTKQLCNRLLEPFMYHTVIVTATEWDNFFNLRAHPDAEIHIQDLAYKMKEALEKSTPKSLKAGEWHIPFGDNFDNKELAKACRELKIPVLSSDDGQMVKIWIATARCARISYQTLGDNPKIDYKADIKLHDMLLRSGHMSPFEHCAKAMNYDECNVYPLQRCRNFRGWIQYRELVEK